MPRRALPAGVPAGHLTLRASAGAVRGAPLHGGGVCAGGGGGRGHLRTQLRVCGPGGGAWCVCVSLCVGARRAGSAWAGGERVSKQLAVVARDSCPLWGQQVCRPGGSGSAYQWSQSVLLRAARGRFRHVIHYGRARGRPPYAAVLLIACTPAAASAGLSQGAVRGGAAARRQGGALGQHFACFASACCCLRKRMHRC